MTDPIERSTFAGKEGTTLQVVLDEGAVPLRLEEIEDHGPADGSRFSVFFSGPGEQPLPQGTRHVQWQGGEPFALFLVPVALEDGRYRYEAAVNREDPTVSD